MVFIAEIGKQNIGYTLTSKAIDSQVIKAALGSSTEYSNTLTINFRNCNWL